ncbi:hypothetical protein CDG79_02635 [Nostoc sp. 'Peltigera membranacea cyanobiont' 232]|nr:hypothetical protein CDG79_02635 [Nostoc sp. 'Peltigera membranacea cyanobiont' 232]
MHNQGKPIRVLQVKKCPIVIASEAKQSQNPSLRAKRSNDGFWIIYFFEHSKAIFPPQPTPEKPKFIHRYLLNADIARIFVLQLGRSI